MIFHQCGIHTASALLGAFLLFNACGAASAAGVVAETNGGKIVIFEREIIGAGLPPKFTGAHLKIIDRSGTLLFEDRFENLELIEYDEQQPGGSIYLVRLHLKSEKSEFNLSFHGAILEIDYSDDSGPIEMLLKELQRPERKIDQGSSLKLNTSIGAFSFKDVLCAIYGDV